MKITKSIKALVGSVALLAIAYAVAHAAALNSQPVGSILSCGLSRFSCTATISTLTGPASFTTTALATLPDVNSRSARSSSTHSIKMV